MSIIGDVERQVRERVAELEPLVAEHRQLMALLETFERQADGPSRPAKARRSASRNGGSTSRGTSGRAEQALALVAAAPGITVAQLADEMQIGPTYLYRLLPALERDGRVTKSGRGYHPATA